MNTRQPKKHQNPHHRGCRHLKVGIEMELATMTLFTDDDGVERIVHAWRIAS